MNSTAAAPKPAAAPKAAAAKPVAEKKPAAAKKAGRVAAEGLIGVLVQGTKGVVVEVNSETDFVAKNADFQALVREVARLDGPLKDLVPPMVEERIRAKVT